MLFMFSIIICLILLGLIYYYCDGIDDIFKYSFDMNYDVIEIENVLSEEECNEIIQLAISNELENSEVWNDDDSTTVDYSHRISEQTWLANNHPLVDKIRMLSEKYTGFPMEKQELIQVVKYNVGGKFESHYDAWVYGKYNGKDGQRKCTFMIYLNDDFEGGTTEFPYINKKVYPSIGKAVIFNNTDSYQNVIFQSLHRGNIITRGSKWICTVWSH